MVTLVTGATGFIGSAVVRRLLARGQAVRVLIDPGFQPRVDLLAGLDVERVPGDVRDRAALDRAMRGCDQLYHLAAIYTDWSLQPEQLYEVNVEGSKNILWSAYKAGVARIVYTSSIAAVGRRHNAPADETCEFSRIDWREGNGYIRSKWLSERDALRFAQEGLPLVVVNPGFPFGPGDVAPTPTGRFILAALRKQMPGYFPGGFCAIDVDDLAEGHVLAGARGRIGERYILANHNVSYGEFFHRLGVVAGAKMPTVRMPDWLVLATGWMLEKAADHVTQRPPLLTYKGACQMVRQLHFDNRKAREELGLPCTPLEETLERSVRWFRDNKYV